MEEKNKLEGLIEQDLDKTSSFTDIMSKSEKKKLKKYKNEEEKEEKKKEKREPKIEEPQKEKKPIAFGVLLLLITLGILGFLAYKGFYLKGFSWQEYLIDVSLVIPLFFASLVCFTKKKIFRILSYLTLVLGVFLNFAVKFDYLTLPQEETLPNFVGKNIEEVLDYTSKHNLTLEQTYEYSDNVEEYYIIMQDKEAGTLLKEVKSIGVTVSYGPNYEKEIVLPSMVGWNIDDALKTIEENFLNNVTVNYVINEEVEKDTILSQSVTGGMKRNAELVLEVSLGSADDLVPVEMIDLKEKSLFEATLWLKRNGISYELQYEFSDSVKRNYVLSQSEKKGSTVDPNSSKVTLIVSKGKEITVPDLLSMTTDEVISWITKNNLKISFSDRYDTTIELGKIIEANYKKGEVVEEGTTIQIVTSKGQLKMKEFSDLNSFRTWASTYGINYQEEYEFNSSIASGEIIKFSVSAGEVLDPNNTIIVTVSNGSAVTIPNFYGMTKSSAQTSCKNAGLNCSFYYSNSTNTKDTVISQNKKANSQVIRGTYVKLALSNGTSGNNSNTNTCTSTESRAIVIQANWVTGGSANATISTLKTKLAEKYPKVTFNFVTKAGNKPSGYIHEDSPITNGSTVQDCKTYTIIINE